MSYKLSKLLKCVLSTSKNDIDLHLKMQTTACALNDNNAVIILS